ncbi:hypothetical protein K431DRAFT_281528 [Polychaeton citri CBS 116435]|uniref:Membrane-associated, eicosanoid/glutathione metabolism (MAPEG) protein n=1 Tax=Polychaeton citri CBS 116435 TaxID=1314669 RepID=A0A9P4UUD9_9PEZI|nr:hypothetical protein K431DRAFT_281528 [Polychaeton citri CBS 116435]
MDFFRTTNVSYFTIPVCWAISLAPRVYSSKGYKKATGKAGFDGRHPRDFKDKIASDPALDSATKGRLIRAEAAVANGFENLGLFAAAVAAGNSAHLDAGLMNTFSIAYIVSRFIYNHIYIYNDTVQLAGMRTVCYTGQIIGLMFVFIKSGLKLNGA